MIEQRTHDRSAQRSSSARRGLFFFTFPALIFAMSAIARSAHAEETCCNGPAVTTSSTLAAAQVDSQYDGSSSQAEAQAEPPSDDEIGMAVYVGDALLRSYSPDSSLVTDETILERSTYPAFDVHCHWSIEQDPIAMLEAMDRRNISRALNLSGGWGQNLDAMLEKFHTVDPERFVIFCNIDFSRIDEPDFGEAMSAYLREAKAKGVSGLKIFKSLGLRYRDASGELIPVDDPRLDPIWETCGEIGFPVLIHVADPPAFFKPIDEKNERWMQLKRHPDWSFYGEEFPSLDELFAQRSRMMERHSDTIFIGPHMGSHASDLATAARMLDRHPNLYYDISGRVAELGRQPYSARKFLLKYQDRILFGTDRYPGRTSQPRYRVYYRFLETDDEHFDYHEHTFPPTGEWKIYGVFLPDDV
ncbi:amidohydrolase family protein, partial [Candidatus Peregrinibacteria bacterium]|nr:amidohydrolase family protein [Candidatus Peregrinibacteria bacterium]